MLHANLNSFTHITDDDHFRRANALDVVADVSVYIVVVCYATQATAYGRESGLRGNWVAGWRASRLFITLRTRRVILRATL